MCLVTFIARKNGFALGMNRDEKLTRTPGRPPAIEQIGGRRALFPSEPGGGTWIGVNDSGIGFALINWYAISARVAGQSVSRGAIGRSVLAADSIVEAEKILAALPLNRVNPFRLIGFFAPSAKTVEWRWNLVNLEMSRHDWETKAWISSGFDEPGAQKSRGKTFAAARRQPSAGSLRWLRRLHRSHKPARGPYSNCMHRDDAATVSYAEVAVAARKATMRYHAGAPCQDARNSFHSLKLVKPIVP